MADEKVSPVGYLIVDSGQTWTTHKIYPKDYTHHVKIGGRPLDYRIAKKKLVLSYEKTTASTYDHQVGSAVANFENVVFHRIEDANLIKKELMGLVMNTTIELRDASKEFKEKKGILHNHIYELNKLNKSMDHHVQTRSMQMDSIHLNHG